MVEKLRTVLVTDRSQTDVNRGKYLLSLFDSSGIWRGTEAERIELEENHGFYTFVDVNRVLRACAWLAGKLEGYGYGVPFAYYKACLITTKAEPPEGGTAKNVLCYAGEPAVVEAVSEDGYRFRRWQENGETVSTDRRYQFTTDSDRELTAVYGVITEEESSVVGLSVVGSAILGKDIV